MYLFFGFYRIPYCPAVPPPPPFCDLLPGKRGGGITMRTCAFASQLSPPLLPRICVYTEIDEALLCSRRRELLRLTCRGSTEGWKSCWPRTCCHFLQQVVSQPDSSHWPRDYTAGTRTELLASGNRPRSVKKAKTSSQTIFYTLDTRVQLLYTCNTRTHARTAVPQTGSSGPWGRRVNGGKITLYNNFTLK